MKSRHLGLESISYLVHELNRHLGEEGPQTRKLWRKVLFQVTLKTKSFCIAFYESYTFTMYPLLMNC
jgi:hypothetical protein